jgi:hypothetical protein
MPDGLHFRSYRPRTATGCHRSRCLFLTVLSTEMVKNVTFPPTPPHPRAVTRHDEVPTHPQRRKVTDCLPLPDALTAVYSSSWWWVNVSPETCRAVYKGIKHCTQKKVSPCWNIFKNWFTMHGQMSIKYTMKYLSYSELSVRAPLLRNIWNGAASYTCSTLYKAIDPILYIH